MIGGTISYPIDQMTYDNNIICSWEITSLSITHRTLIFTFLHFDTEYFYDELLIGETVLGVSRYNSKLTRFSGPKIPEPFYISYEKSVWLEFSTDDTTVGTGFILEYAFIDRTVSMPKPVLLIDANIQYNADDNNDDDDEVKTHSFPIGTIFSPNYPKNYSNYGTCRWRLHYPGALIRIRIDHFDTEQYYDKLTFVIGQNSESAAMVLTELSGELDVLPKHIFVPNDSLWMIFTTDRTTNATGFILQYEIITKETKCSSIDIKQIEGHIQSVNYPQSLRSNLDCTWKLYLPSTYMIIEIQFHDLHLASEKDYLTVHSGGRLTPYTGEMKATKILFHSSNITLNLITRHSSDNYRGFNLSYRGISINEEDTHHRPNTTELAVVHQRSSCGGRYLASFNGTVLSPGYPVYDYPVNIDCTWIIDVFDGQNVLLRFDDFDLDSEEDIIQIGLLNDVTKYQLFAIHDTQTDGVFIANYSQIWIRFRTNIFSLPGRGFRLYFSETTLWSTVLPLDEIITIDSKSLPLHLNSLTPHLYRQLRSTMTGYYNLTQIRKWIIQTSSEESIEILFNSILTVPDHRMICFHIESIDGHLTSVCNNQLFPIVIYQTRSF
ncbi:unnamed protein product, partial [Didymodactylos carnosus]